MEEKTPSCCPNCMCRDVSKTRDRGMIEIGPMELEQEDVELPVDIWTCSKCNRRFVMLEDSEEA